MESLILEIREAVKKLFEEDKVDLVIGFEEGSLPLKATPCFIRSAEDADKLTWNSMCENNLAVYVPGKKERVGVIAKGCDSRSLVGHIQEMQIKRENLLVIGVPCRGMVDRKKLKDHFGDKEILSVEEGPDEILFKGDGFEESLKRSDLLNDSCTACMHRNPVIHDILIGQEVQEQEGVDEFEVIKGFEAKPSDERWAYFSKQSEKCIRCYACRNACPLCYCEVCCVDESQPQWFGKSVALSDTQVFQLMRTYHTAGRCVDCGACVRACPMDIDLRFMNKKIDKDVRELFSYEAGLDPEAPLPLNTFKTDDEDEFIKG